MRWVDARYAMILPDSDRSQVLIPDSTPYHPAFENSTAGRYDHPPLAMISILVSHSMILKERQNLAVWTKRRWLILADAIQLFRQNGCHPRRRAGETAELLTVWRVS